MTRRRLDLYAECNGGQAPEQEFTEACCSRCVNPECSRSLYGKGGFDDRVHNWYERLFSQVPRLAADDPRYGKIAGQRFLLIDPDGSTQPSGASDWVDPQDLEAKSVLISRAVSPTPAPIPVPVQNTPPDPPAQVGEFKQEPATASPSGVLNTPAKQGQMLPGKATPPTAPASGGWVTPPPAPTHAVPDAKVVKSGARIKLGS